VADSVFTLGLDLSAFEAVLRQSLDGVDKRTARSIAAAQRAAGEAVREASKVAQEAARAQARQAREASDALKAQERAAKEAAAASERAAREAEKAAEEARKQTQEGLKGLGELLGFPVDKVEKLGQAFGLVGGPLAALAGGAAIATAALALTAGAVYGLVSAAIDLDKELAPLREDGLLPPIDPAWTASLEEADHALAGAGAAVKDLVVRLGGQLAPAVEWAAVAVGNMATAVANSGLTLASFGVAARTGVVAVLQTMVDWALMIPSIYARMAGLVGRALEGLGFTSLGGQLREVTDDALAFKNSIGEMIGGGVIDMWVEGVTLMGREADVSGGSVRRLGAAVRASGDATKAAATAAKDAAKAQEDAAKAAREWAREQGMVAAAAQDLARLAPELEALIAQLERAAEVELAARFAEAEQGVADYGSAVRDLVMQPIKGAASAAVDLGKALLSSVGLSAGSAVQMLLQITTDAVSAQQAAAEGVTAARTELATAIASGDTTAIAEAREGLKAARQELEAADPTAFTKGLIDGATDMVIAIVDALPGVVEGIVESAPRLITALVDAIPALVIALVKAIPEIAGSLAVALAIELPLALVASLPDIVKALGEGIVGAWVAAASRIKRVIGDIFKEIATGGRADTKTFGDTPGPVRVGASGARVSPGDYVVAARSREGLAAQTGQGQPSAQPLRVVLDVRDGPVALGLSIATSRQAQREGWGRDTTGRRSPYRSR
jgi:hypothetical protein